MNPNPLAPSASAGLPSVAQNEKEAPQNGEPSFAELLGAADPARKTLATASFAPAETATGTADAPLVRPRSAAKTAPGARREKAHHGASGMAAQALIPGMGFAAQPMAAEVIAAVSPGHKRIGLPVVKRPAVAAAFRSGLRAERAVVQQGSVKRPGELHPSLLPSAGVLDPKARHASEAKKALRIEAREPSREPERPAQPTPGTTPLAEARRPAHDLPATDGGGTTMAPQADGPVVAFAPPAAAPLLAQAAEDPGLRLGVLSNAAHLAIERPEGNLALHVRVRDGAAEIRIGGNMASLFEARAPEMQIALASAGLSLGRFDLEDQRRGGEPPREDDEPAPVSTAQRRTPEAEVVATDGRIHVTA